MKYEKPDKAKHNKGKNKLHEARETKKQEKLEHIKPKKKK